jgi:hypothetical protein
VAANFGHSVRPPGERVAGVAVQAPGELQGYVDEATHGPWTGERTPPQADAEARDAMLRLWYGEPGAADRVVLRCDPIPLAGIQPGG